MCVSLIPSFSAETQRRWCRYINLYVEYTVSQSLDQSAKNSIIMRQDFISCHFISFELYLHHHPDVNSHDDVRGKLVFLSNQLFCTRSRSSASSRCSCHTHQSILICSLISLKKSLSTFATFFFFFSPHESHAWSPKITRSKAGKPPSSLTPRNEKLKEKTGVSLICVLFSYLSFKDDLSCWEGTWQSFSTRRWDELCSVNKYLESKEC